MQPDQIRRAEEAAEIFSGQGEKSQMFNPWGRKLLVTLLWLFSHHRKCADLI